MDTDSTQIGRPTPRTDTYPHRELTEKIIGAAYEVQRELGPGFLEKVYETALIDELRNRGVPAIGQAEIEVRYKDTPVGNYYADILVDSKVICEIKAVDNLSRAHEAQLIHYLKAAGIKVGLLLNFGAKQLEIKRRIF